MVSERSMPTRWSKKEDKKLQEAVEEVSPSPLENSDKENSPEMVSERSTPRRWSKKEDKKLQEAVKEVLRKQGTIAWKKVAAKVEGRDRTQCRQRWKYTLSNDIKKGPFSPSEDKCLLAIVTKARTDTTAGIKWKKDSGIRVSVFIIQ